MIRLTASDAPKRFSIHSRMTLKATPGSVVVPDLAASDLQIRNHFFAETGGVVFQAGGGMLRTDPAMLPGAGGLDGFFIARWNRPA